MELRIGLYAFFAYTLSGVAYFAIGLVIAEVKWPNMNSAIGKEWPLPFLLVATALCYFIGLLLDPLARLLFRIIYRRPSRDIAIDEITEHYPAASLLKETYWPLLLAELHLVKESLVDHADVYKAACMLLRNIGTAAFVGAVVILGGLFWSFSQLALLVGCSLAVAAVLAFVESRKFDGWFYSSICQRLLVLRAQKAVSPKSQVETADMHIGSGSPGDVTAKGTMPSKRAADKRGRSAAGR